MANDRAAENGKATRFKPGDSGNPKGRPKDKPWVDAFRKYGKLPVKELASKDGDTAIEAVVKKAYIAMLKDPQARLIREAADRTEGRVPLPLIGSSDEPIAIVINSPIPRPDRSKRSDKPKVSITVHKKKPN